MLQKVSQIPFSQKSTTATFVQKKESVATYLAGRTFSLSNSYCKLFLWRQ